MKLGVDIESLHLWIQNKRMDLFGFIDLAKNMGMDGIMINLVEKKNLHQGLGSLGANDPEHLKRVREYIEERDMYVELAGRGTDEKTLTELIDVADKVGAKVLRSFVMSGGGYTISETGGIWDEEKFYRASGSIKAVIPLLEDTGITLALENHELETSKEVRKLVEIVGHEQVGVLFDAGNSMMAWEDPVDALKNLLPYVRTTHIKDHVISEYQGETFICGAALGEGHVQLPEIMTLLDRYTDLDHVNIEMCAPYASQFKRPAGTGGVSKTGQGAFVVDKLPLPKKMGSPKGYYVYEGPYLEEMLAWQMEAFKRSCVYMKNLLEKIKCQK